MSEFKGTPGPWWLRSGDATGFKTHSGGASVLANARPDDAFFVMKIAEMATNVRESEREANARLIAAAPELLETVQALQNAFGPWKAQTVKQTEAFAAARAVVAKATGSEAA